MSRRCAARPKCNSSAAIWTNPRSSAPVMPISRLPIGTRAIRHWISLRDQPTGGRHGLPCWVGWRGIGRTNDYTPFVGVAGLFLLAFLGLAISTFPYLVPPTLTIWDTAAVPDSQIFTLIGTLVLLPVILGYFVFVFWTFRGKVSLDHEDGYH